MSERRTNTVHGYVNFPIGKPGWKDSREGGLAVYAVWLTSPEVCISGASAMMYGDCIPSVNDFLFKPVDRQRTVLGVKTGHREYHDLEGFHVRGFVYLGSTGASLWTDKNDGHYFFANESDLTIEGQTLIKSLNKLYGSHAHFVTFLDT